MQMQPPPAVLRRWNGAQGFQCTLSDFSSEIFARPKEITNAATCSRTTLGTVRWPADRREGTKQGTGLKGSHHYSYQNNSHNLPTLNLPASTLSRRCQGLRKLTRLLGPRDSSLGRGPGCSQSQSARRDQSVRRPFVWFSGMLLARRSTPTVHKSMPLLQTKVASFLNCQTGRRIISLAESY